MTTSNVRIRELVEKGALPPEQAKDLLAALHEPGAARRPSLLLDPLMRFGGEWLSCIGAVAVIAGAALGRLRINFDGFLDLHIGSHPLGVLEAALQALVLWPYGALVLWLASLVAGRRGRFIDFLGVVGVARVPLVVFALPMAVRVLIDPPPVLQPGQMPQVGPTVLAMSFVFLIGLIWFVMLAYRGFVVASGLTGARRWIAFIVAVLVAELTSKTLLFVAYRAFGLF
jgi:Yip1-like protein